MSVGINIKKYRKAQGYTQDRLAELVHVTANTVYRWEAGMMNPTFDTLAILADILDCTVGDLVASNPQ